MLESIEKLRELAADINSTEIIDNLDVIGKFVFHSEWLDSWHGAFDAACGEIEREIAERYMELPLDADGVPIHLYDKLLKSTGAAEPTYGEVVGISDDSVFFSEKQGWSSNWSRLTRHVKPRTIEDVLESFIEDYDHWDEFAHFERGESRNKLFARYADEIWKVVGE